MGSSTKGNGRKRKLWLRALAWAIFALLLVVVVALADAWSALGTKPGGARLERIQRSPQFREGKFVDTIPRVDPDLLAATLRWFKGVEHSAPTAPLPVLLRTSADFATPAESGLRITPYVHPRVAIVSAIGEGSDAELDVLADVGVDLDFTPNLSLRLGVNLGNGADWGIGVALRR